MEQIFPYRELNSLCTVNQINTAFTGCKKKLYDSDYESRCQPIIYLLNCSCLQNTIRSNELLLLLIKEKMRMLIELQFHDTKYKRTHI